MAVLAVLVLTSIHNSLIAVSFATQLRINATANATNNQTVKPGDFQALLSFKIRSFAFVTICIVYKGMLKDSWAHDYQWTSRHQIQIILSHGWIQQQMYKYQTVVKIYKWQIVIAMLKHVFKSKCGVLSFQGFLIVFVLLEKIFRSQQFGGEGGNPFTSQEAYKLGGPITGFHIWIGEHG